MNTLCDVTMYAVNPVPMPMVDDVEEGFCFLAGAGTEDDPFRCFSGFPSLEQLRTVWLDAIAATGDRRSAARAANNFGAGLVAQGRVTDALDPLLKAERTLADMVDDEDYGTDDDSLHGLILARYNVAVAYRTAGNSGDNVRRAKEWLDRLLPVWERTDPYYRPHYLHMAVTNLQSLQ